MKPKREYQRLQRICNSVKKEHPDWTEEQIENESTEIMLGLKPIPKVKKVR
jgi:hypothetical protein